MLVIGLACLVWLDSFNGFYFAYMISIAARFAFCLITQMYFANYAASGRVTPTQSFGLGWLFVHIGDLLGIVFTVALGPSVGQSISMAMFSVSMMVFLIIVTMFVINDKESFFTQSLEKVSAPRIAASHEEEGSEEGSPAGTGASLSARDTFEEHVRTLPAFKTLTPREQEVFLLLAHGRSIPYVRDELVISKETASTHVKHIYAKIGIHSRQELIDLVQRP